MIKVYTNEEVLSMLDTTKDVVRYEDLEHKQWTDVPGFPVYSMTRDGDVRYRVGAKGNKHRYELLHTVTKDNIGQTSYLCSSLELMVARAIRL